MTRSEDQIDACALIVDGIQDLFELARVSATADDAKDWHLVQPRRLTRVLLHGPGGSGKTYCLTEVVIPVVRAFCGERGVKAIASTNAAARMLLGQTMHAAGKMTRQQSLKAKDLTPKARARKALEKEWQDLFFLLADELRLAKLLADEYGLTTLCRSLFNSNEFVILN